MPHPTPLHSRHARSLLAHPSLPTHPSLLMHPFRPKHRPRRATRPAPVCALCAPSAPCGGARTTPAPQPARPGPDPVPVTDPLSPIRRGSGVPGPSALPIPGERSMVEMGAIRRPRSRVDPGPRAVRPLPTARRATEAGPGAGVLGAGPPRRKPNGSSRLTSRLPPRRCRHCAVAPKPPSTGAPDRTGVTGSSEEDAMLPGMPPSRSAAPGPSRPTGAPRPAARLRPAGFAAGAAPHRPLPILDDRAAAARPSSIGSGRGGVR